jgi:hypothetical protein
MVKRGEAATSNAGGAQWTDAKLDAPGIDNAAMSSYWDMVDCIVTGADAMRKAGKLYLPQFPNETNKNYSHRKNNAKFTNVYRDILEGLSAKPFEEPIKLDEANGDQLKKFCENVDGAGNSITSFALHSFFNAINNAIDWLFIDYEKPIRAPGDRPLTQAEETTLGLRPYWCRVRAKNVLEVRTGIIGGQKVLTYIRILEPAIDGGPNKIRIIQRIGDIVTWELWVYEMNPTVNKMQWRLEDTGPITIGVIPLVPIIIGRQNGEAWQFFPPMRDAADLQIELYQAESGLKNVRNLSGFPMLTGNGVQPDKLPNGNPKELQTGPAVVLYGPPNPGGGPPGSWVYVQPEATVLTWLSSDVQSMIDQLRELGRQPLTAQSGNLTVITAGVAAGKANSAVAMWALALGKALGNALEMTALWFGDKTTKPKVEVFTDFEILGNVDDLNQLATARGKGDISQLTYWEALVRRDVLPADFDPEEEKKRLLAEGPADIGTADGNPNDPNILPPGPPGKAPPPTGGKPAPKGSSAGATA